MERNDAGNEGLTNGQTDANEFSGSAPAQPQTPQSEFGAPASEPFAPRQPQGIRERARSAIGTAGGKLADVGSTTREKVGVAKDKLADALQSGAERLRDRGRGTGGATLAGATADGSTAIQSDGKVAQVSDKVAGGMQATADWLREADLDGLKTGIENQVKEHPGRTLLIAAGLGYLIGRAFRKDQ
jgi:hypothetical protein